MSKKCFQKQISFNGRKYLVSIQVDQGGKNDLYRYRVDLRDDEYHIIGQRTKGSNELLDLVELVKWAVKDMPVETFVTNDALKVQAKNFEEWDGRIDI